MKYTYYTNGINEKRFLSDDIIPYGWHKGRLKSTITTEGYHWYTDGYNNLLLSPNDEIPYNFYLGRVGSKESSSKQSTTMKSRHFKHYNNGIKEKLIGDGESIPEGFVLGRLKMSEEHKLKLSKSHRGKHHNDDTKKKISQNSNNNREKAFKTLSDKWGSMNEFYSYIHNKGDETKRINKTFNTSRAEKDMYKVLCETYGKFDIKTNYKSDVYPYRCDFYIKSLDKYIELNLHWTHGGRPYVENDEDCANQLKVWKEKSKVSKFYENAIETWTRRDVEKLECAKKNNLNYEVIY